jgi:hypothetical protein
VVWIDEIQQGSRIWNTALRRDGIEIYVRHAIRTLEGREARTLDIARVNLVERQRGRGRFSAFLRLSLLVNPWDAVRVEYVQNDSLAARLRRDGWREEPARCPNFYHWTRNTHIVA